MWEGGRRTLLTRSNPCDPEQSVPKLRTDATKYERQTRRVRVCCALRDRLLAAWITLCPPSASQTPRIVDPWSASCFLLHSSSNCSKCAKPEKSRVHEQRLSDRKLRGRIHAQDVRANGLFQVYPRQTPCTRSVRIPGLSKHCFVPSAGNTGKRTLAT